MNMGVSFGPSEASRAIPDRLLSRGAISRSIAPPWALSSGQIAIVSEEPTVSLENRCADSLRQADEFSGEWPGALGGWLGHSAVCLR